MVKSLVNSTNKYLSNTPLVSVIMPVYNAGPYLREAIDSVLNQTYKNIELICVDDGSTDDSLSVLNEYAQSHKDTVKVYKNPRNLGVSRTSNYALSKAAGDLIARLDSDDIMTPSRIEKQVRFLLKNSGVIVVGGQVEMIDIKGKKIGDKTFSTDSDEIYETMFTMMAVQQGAMMVNTTKIPNGFVWYKGDSRTAEEVDLFFKLIRYGKFANLRDVVLKYRQYGTSTSLANVKETFFLTFAARLTAAKKYGYRPTLKAKFINYAQYVVVSLLPAGLIHPLFGIWRGMRTIRISTPVWGVSKKAFHKLVSFAH